MRVSTQTPHKATARRKQPRVGTVIPGPRLSPLYYRDRQRNNNGATTEEPFFLLFLKTALTLAAFCCIAFIVFSYQTLLPSRQNSADRYNTGLQLLPKRNERGGRLMPTVPVFTLGPDANSDAFGVAARYNLTLAALDGNTNIMASSHAAFIRHANKLRNDFTNLYGGPVSARSILERGLSHTSSVDGLARRLRQRQRQAAASVATNPNNNTAFNILVVGSSAAAGYGNLHEQSYSFFLQHVLSPMFESTGLSLQVQNLAMEDLAEFPFTWCLQQEHSYDSPAPPDILIWDFGTDTPPARFEAFVRVAAANLWRNGGGGNNDTHQHQQQQPFFMFREGSAGTKARSDIIQHYSNAGVLNDPVTVRHSQAAQPFLTMDMMDRPDGLNKWRDYGVTGPAQSLTLLSRQQHELVGWLVAMHLLAALELVTADQVSGGRVLVLAQESTASAVTSSADAPLLLLLPPPLHPELQALRDQPWAPLVLGSYDTARLQCVTSYEHAVRDADMEPDAFSLSATPNIASNMQDWIVSGTIGQDFELLLPKKNMWYNRAWVLDLDPAAKRTKMLLKETEHFGGFTDWKKAYYGVPQSGVLQLFVPVGSDAELEHRVASHVVDFVILCESDAPQDADSCTLRHDASVSVGGQAAVVTGMDTDIVATFEKQTCVHVSIPDNAVITKRSAGQSRRLRQSNGGTAVKNDASETYGLSVSVQVTNDRVTWAKGPCSVAQILFQRAA